MKRCNRCGRKFNGPGDAGPVCRRKRAKKIAALSGRLANEIESDRRRSKPKFKAFFMSHPRTTATGRRSWLVRPAKGNAGSWLVRIFPDEQGRAATCDCPEGRANLKCEHIIFIADIDAAKFKPNGENNES